MNSLYISAPEVACFANDNDAFVPEHWAMEGLIQLQEEMVVANLVHRDFENQVASFGQTVNTRRPGEFKIRRKTDATTTLDKQDASATNVAVTLNQWFYNSFVIKDGEQSMSFKDLVGIYLVPSMRTIARSVDRSVLGHFHQFLSTPSNRSGRLLNLAAATSHEVVLDAREKLNRRNAPLDAQRHLLLSAMSETALLQNTMFIKANERGDGGVALENARLGRILGFNTWLAQNVPYCDLLSADIVTGTLTGANAAGVTPTSASTGDCTITGKEAVKGSYVTIAGDDQPKWITAVTATTNTTSITVNEPLKYANEALAVLTLYTEWTMKAEVYDINHVGILNVASGYTNDPQVGQLVSFGDTPGTRHTYTIIEVEDNASSGVDIHLDRPVEVQIGSGATAFPGPAGSFNMAFHREALALVTRPLAVPAGALGVMSGVADYENIGMRVTMQYDIDAGGTVVNCDILAGVRQLDANLGVVMLG